MSEYGWLAESTIIPKKPGKKIEVDDSSLVSLQVALMQKKEDASNGTKATKKLNKQQELFMKKNKGVEERMKKDLVQEITEKTSQNMLAKKEKIYENLQKGGKNISKLLVDFEQKKIDNMNEDEKKNYEKERMLFYEEKKKELQQREEEIQQKKFNISQYSMNKQFVQEEIERHEWEKEMLQELEDGVTEEMKELGKKNLIQQRYDRHATADEKKQLEQVLKEESKEQQLLNEIKKKRNLAQEQRKNKLQQLNLE
ncbi:hypothetical protein ABPG72_020715 [Tetrahymena utriculariae]